MIKRYRDIVTSYVRSLKLDSPAELGDEPIFAVEDKERIVADLRHQLSQNQTLLGICVGLWMTLFIVGVCLVWEYRDDAAGLVLVLGGNLIVLSGIMWALRRLWLESSTMGALLAILPSLSPREAAKVIMAFYLNAIDSLPDRRSP